MDKSSSHFSKLICILLVVIMLVVFSPQYIAVAGEMFAEIIEEDGQVFLQWTACTCDEYVVYLNGKRLSSTTSTYLDITSAVADGGDYTFTIYASTNGEETLLATSSTFNRTIYLSTPTNITLTEDTLTWDSVQYATDYSVYVNDVVVATTSKTNIKLSLAKSGSYKVAVVPNGKNEYYIPPSKQSVNVNYTCWYYYPINVYIFSTLNGVVISFKQIDSIIYSLTLSNAQQIVYSNQNATSYNIFTLEEGEIYTIKLTGVLDGNNYLFYNESFEIVNGEVQYED